MSIIEKKESFSIKRIEKLPTGWKFYPSKKELKPIFISHQKYKGKIPHVFKFFWQKRILEVSFIGDFMISAKLDGVLLFKIPEDDYPENIKKEIAAFKKRQEEYQKELQEKDKLLQKELEQYLATKPPYPFLEDEIDKLRFPFRAYMKLHLFKDTAPNSRTRLSLVLVLCRIAERIYKRHIRETDKKYSADLSCLDAKILFSSVLGEYFPHYLENNAMANMEKTIGSEKAQKTFFSYYEADELLNDSLAVTPPDNVKRYLNYIIREMLSLFADDWWTWQENFAICRYKRIYTDEQEYLRQYKKMKLLHYTNFILPQKHSQKTIDNFIRFYSL